MQNLGVMKKIKFAQEGPMYTHNNFCTSTSVRVHTADINVKRLSVLNIISQATYIRLKNSNNGPPLNMARGNQISNAVGTGPKAHSGGPKAHHSLNTRMPGVRSRASHLSSPQGLE